jgi:glycine/D-amino acid oxidase-like deaminating enzyme
MIADTIVIGNGLFGAIIAKSLRAIGQTVFVIDSNEERAGSKPAGCLMKPSWYSGLGKEVHEPSMKLLDSLYGVQTVQFSIKPVGSAEVYWIPPSSILSGEYCVGKVTDIKQADGGWLVAADIGDFEMYHACKNLVVAAGVWTEKLLEKLGVFPKGGMAAQTGISWVWDGALKENTISVWAPYRQLVAMNFGEGKCWAGDGTSIKDVNFGEKHVQASWNRCSPYAEASGGFTNGKGIIGMRPYMKGHKPCYLAEPLSGLWVATGGAKNGTVAAGYCAHVITEALK